MTIRIEALLASVLGTAAYWVVAPPAVKPGPQGDAAGFAVTRMLLLATAAVGWLIGWALARAWRSRVRNRKYVWAAVALALLSCSLAGIRYLSDRAELVVPYRSLDIITGSVLTRDGQAFFDENENASREFALRAFTGHYERIWTSESISESRFFLWWQCLASLLCAIVIIVVVTELVAGQRRSKKVE